MNQPSLATICDAYESAWRRGERPLLEEYISRVDTSEQRLLLIELLQIEWWWLGNQTDAFEQTTYQLRFPQHIDVVETAYRQYIEKTEKPNFSFTTLAAGETATEHRESVPDALLQTGRFHVDAKLGSGAFGSVWKAYDTQLKRMVALKFPHADSCDGALRERFVREYQAAARLRHDGIVSIYDVCNVTADVPVIVSQYVDGQNLAELRQEHGIVSSIEAAALGADLADAMSHAHRAGIIHRDLKPSNVLIDSVGKSYITDFGLAKDLRSETTFTIKGDLIGTAAYIAPEQASGQADDADPRCDIYAIGVILYEMVTGERPFRGTLQAVLQQVVRDSPPPPQKLNTGVARDLQTIILKCMEKSPEYRFQTAADLRDDLLRFVHNEPILAKPPGMLERFVKWYPSHATEMLGTYFIVAPLTWVFFIAGGLLESQERSGYQLSSLVFLPWAVMWMALGAMILKKGFWFEIMNLPLLIAFISLPLWLNEGAQSLALICLIGFWGTVLQIGAFVSHRTKLRRTGEVLVSRLSSS